MFNKVTEPFKCGQALKFVLARNKSNSLAAQQRVAPTKK